MALKGFHLFPRLPPELRLKIYKLATPARIVDVRESFDEEYEDFEDRLSETWCSLKLDPSLAYFARSWRRFIPFGNRQPMLESFGFKAPAPVRPWTPSPATPEIPLAWLKDHPDVAWVVLRRSSLYSVAPIPALLHTCHEARSVLQSWGYQLAFRTRSCEARTWFHFGRDVLYLRYDHEEERSHSLLSGASWDISQFDPTELQQVRKLGLSRSVAFVRVYGNGSEIAEDDSMVLSKLARMFGGLEELLMPEFTSDCCSVDFTHPNGGFYGSSEWPEPWDCVPVEEVDALMLLFRPDRFWNSQIISAGPNGTLLRRYKQQNGNAANYYEFLHREIASRLAENQQRLLSLCDAASGWSLPKPRIVHILPNSEINNLWKARRETVKLIRALKSGLGSGENQIILAPENLGDDDFELTLADEEIFSQLLDEEYAIDLLQREENELADLHDFYEDEETLEAIGYYHYQTTCQICDNGTHRAQEEKEWWIRECSWEVLDDPNDWVLYRD